MEDWILSRARQGKVSEKPSGSPYSFLLLAGWRNLSLVLTFHWPRLASSGGIPPSGSSPAEEGVGEGLEVRTRSSLSSGQSDSMQGSLSAQEPPEPSLKDGGAGSHPGCALQGQSVLWPFFIRFTTILSLVLL